MSKSLTLVPVGGLANRMRAIGSAVKFCEKDKRDLSIIWFLDRGLQCSFFDLFRPFEIEELNLKVRDNSFFDLLVYDRPRKKNLYIPALFESLIFQKSIDEETSRNLNRNNISIEQFNNYNKIYLACFIELYSFTADYNIFKPIPLLEKRINELASLFDEYTIGIHIRRTDNIQSINNSPTELFIKKMEEELIKNNKIKFYLASDSVEEKRRLKDIFGEKLITSFNKPRRDTKEGMQEALVEFYALSRTSQIIGSFYSTFSQIAAQISNIKYTILKASD